MYQILSCLRDEHQFLYVLTAIVICIVGSACSVIVFHRGVQSDSILRKRVWACLSGSVLGAGVWATHFVAMLGYRPGFEVHYDGATTLLSVSMAIAGCVAVSQILITGMTMLRRAISSVVVTATVAGMHYYGMTALKQAALIEYDTDYVTASVAVSFVLFSLTYCLCLSTSKRLLNYVGLVLTLLGVASLHFIGMSAIELIPLKGYSTVGWEVDTATLSSWIVFSVAAMIVLAALAAGMDSVIARLRFREQRRMSLLVNAASEAILVVGPNGTVVEANDAVEGLLGKDRNSLTGLNINELLGTTIVDPHNLDRQVSGEQKIKVADDYIPVDISLRSLEDDRDGLQAVTLYDLRERIRNEAHIRSLAYVDQLTGLPNRAAFHKKLEDLTAGATPVERNFSVFVVDLDNFKDVNDQFGPHGGDLALIASARRLMDVFGPTAFVARFGADEFGVIYHDGTNKELLLRLAEECAADLASPIAYTSSLIIRVSASVGISSAQMWGDPLALLKASDRALQAAKQSGRRVHFYDAELHNSTEERKLLEADLEVAVEKNQFELHYQSKVCAKTRRILGHEALVRWNRPGHELVMPNDFIEAAEQSHVIKDIGRWCIYRACADAALWDRTWIVSVNLSARQLMDPKLSMIIRDALRQSGLDPGRLELEVTETALIQNTMVASKVLGRLKKLGILIALDDFGTGYSSLSFIQQFPFDRIKIDRSFVSTMETDRKAAAIVDAILLIGSQLSIPVVAEGVETEAQARRFRDAHGSELQGYLLGRPKPLDQKALQQVAAGLNATG
ncbi:MAG: EAL domain-containing protein [Henriciella sp.]|uniref:putative bifunctional diguanylate cyclase/phosphodiesterase n=1 Tax=Henriciella sp. TaxID=1968823 RepID=UPI003C744BF1